MTVSFVIPVKNDRVRLERCLSSISANERANELLEIVVADNGSTDGTDAAARLAGATVLHLPGLRVSELRNRGARAATGDVIALVDADHELAPDWVPTALDTLTGDRVGAVGALYAAPASGTWVQRTYGALRGRTLGRCDTEWLASGNLAVTRRAFESVGGFDTTLEACEDVDLCQRLRANRWRVVGDERLVSVHWGDPVTLSRLFEAERWRGRDNLRVTCRAPFTFRTFASVVSPIIIVLAVAAMAGALLSAPFVGHRAMLVAVAALGAIASLSALRAVRIMTSTARSGSIGLLQALAVAFIYDLARAAALVTRAAHHRHRSAVGTA